jgi:hypothetical protein
MQCDFDSTYCKTTNCHLNIRYDLLPDQLQAAANLLPYSTGSTIKQCNPKTDRCNPFL